MTTKMGYYNVDDYNKQKRLQGKDLRVPPKANFMAAVNHVRKIFESKKLPYGVMGGMAMLCLGYQRDMYDVHIAYDDRDFHRIKTKLEADQRIRLPEGINSFFPAKCLVRTGPAYRDEGCTQAVDIEVNLIPPGCYGTPPNGDLASNLVLLSLRSEAKLKSYKGLNMLHLVRTLVRYCIAIDLAWDPRNDILFLCQHYGEEVQSIRNQLDHKAVRQNFLGTPDFLQLSIDDQRRCYRVLLGTKPPPIMAVARPPSFAGHKHSASALDLANRPQMSSYNSSPSIRTHRPPDLPHPSSSNKSSTPQQLGSYGVGRPVELPVSSSTESRHIREIATFSKDLRSEYRLIKTSPTIPSNTMHMRQSSQPPALPSQRFPQSLPFQPRSPSHLNPVPVAPNERRSMPNIGPNRPMPPFTSAQAPVLGGFAPQPQHLPSLQSPVEMSAAAAVSIKSDQNFTKVQYGSIGAHPLRQHPVNDHPVTERPVPFHTICNEPSRRSIGATCARCRKRKIRCSGDPGNGMGCTNSRSAGVEAVNCRYYEVGSNTILSSRPHGINANMEVLRKLPPAEGEEPISRLAELPSSSSPPPSASSTYSDDASTARFFSSNDVELDAMSQLGQYIAELSVERNNSAPIQQNEQRLQVYERHLSSYTSSAFRGSPVSPSNCEAYKTSPSHFEDVPIRPLHVSQHSAPLGSLPSSLIPGGLINQQRSPNNSLPPMAPMQADLLSTNANLYVRQISSITPPSSTPSSANASPQPVSFSAYKAYQPPAMALSSPSLPLSPPAIPFPSPESPRPTSFKSLKDIDGMSGYFKAHRRDTSHDSSASHDSNKLAQEYQAELPGYGEGYGPPGRRGT